MRRTGVALGVCGWLAGPAAVNALADEAVTERLDRIENRLIAADGGSGDGAHGETERVVDLARVWGTALQ
jgi:hypothetical protein